MRILIVDDDDIIRRILQDALVSMGTRDAVSNGKEALQAFRLAWEDEEPYQLILLDIMMPGMDGHQVLVEIRRLEKEMQVSPEQRAKVIMVTALDDPKHVIQAYYQEGSTSYLVKPIDQQILLDEILLLGLRP